MITALFLGYKDSGKTTTIVHLTRLLSSRGVKVCVLKHVGGGHRLLDPSKDTGRFIAGGAQAVAALDGEVLALFYAGGGVEEAYRMLAALSPGYILVEGFTTHPLFAGEDVRCVVCARSVEEAAELVRLHHARRIVCATGVFAQSFAGGDVLGVPVVRVPEEVARLAQLLSG